MRSDGNNLWMNVTVARCTGHHHRSHITSRRLLMMGKFISSVPCQQKFYRHVNSRFTEELVVHRCFKIVLWWMRKWPITVLPQIRYCCKRENCHQIGVKSTGAQIKALKHVCLFQRIVYSSTGLFCLH